MSRIGVKAIKIPAGVEVNIEHNEVRVKGSKGELTQTIMDGIKVVSEEGVVSVRRTNNQGQTVAYHGLIRSLIQNMVVGVSNGFEKKLLLVGTGYRAKMQGNKLVLNVGYSNPVEYAVPNDVQISLEGDTIVSVAGINNQRVGQTAAEIRKVRPPEPYKGKGIRYQDEVIRKKAGKAAKVSSA
jgi:large subunit ribosomal protein L6